LVNPRDVHATTTSAYCRLGSTDNVVKARRSDGQLTWIEAGEDLLAFRREPGFGAGINQVGVF
jgi:hypothetical protein